MFQRTLSHQEPNSPLVYIKFCTEVSSHQAIILALSKLKNGGSGNNPQFVRNSGGCVTINVESKVEFGRI